MSDRAPLALAITLDPNGVSTPANLAARESSGIVAFVLNSLDGADLSKPPVPSGSFMTRNTTTFQSLLTFADDVTTEHERKSSYVNWMLARGLQELTRGVRASVEEALLFVRVASLASTEMKFGEFEAQVVALRKEASEGSFADLLKKVSAKLREPLIFSEEFLSLQRARNCLEHAGGIVTARNLDKGSDRLSVKYPGLGIFVKADEDGEEVEVRLPMFVEKGSHIIMRRVTRSRTYNLGEQVTFSAAEFHEIAFACTLFASDLASKLPVVQSPLPALVTE